MGKKKFKLGRGSSRSRTATVLALVGTLIMSLGLVVGGGAAATATDHSATDHCADHTTEAKANGQGVHVLDVDGTAVTVVIDGTEVTFTDADGKPLSVSYCVKASTETFDGSGASGSTDGKIENDQGEAQDISYVVVYSVNPPPQPSQYFLATSHTTDCGSATITLRNVSPWIYPVSYSTDGSVPDADGPQYGPVVDNRGDDVPDDRSDSKTLTFEEDEGSGTVTVKYVVAAGTESDLYQGLPVGAVTTFTVDTDCKPNWSADDQTENRTVESVDCTTKKVTVLEQQRTRTELQEGVWGEWSEWKTVSTTTRDATARECPPPPVWTPRTEGATRTVVDLDCDDRVVTLVEQARSRTETSAGVWGPWSDWSTVGTSERDATEEECPLPEVDEPEVLPDEVVVPKPQQADAPTVKGVSVLAPKKAAAPPAAVPTAVAAGVGEGAATSPQLAAQLLVAGGLLLLLAGGWVGLGRREGGAHEA